MKFYVKVELMTENATDWDTDELMEALYSDKLELSNKNWAFDASVVSISKRGF